MNAILIQKIKRQYAHGIVEVNILQVPGSVPPCRHHYKYRLVYVVNNQRVIGFDNERGKGDHWHYENKEFSYQFVNVETLLADFWKALELHTGDKK
ncbi:conserved hypothetical protein [Gammaproteobacteria bacterium]